jgi:ribosomal protein L37AE/L43A
MERGKIRNRDQAQQSGKERGRIMARIPYSINCPSCGKSISGQRRKDDHKKAFECSKCTARFSVTFDYPSWEELQERFMAGQIPAGLARRIYGRVRSIFPFRLPRSRKPGQGEGGIILKEGHDDR